ncbi:MAG: hypothetical protein RL381_122 [Actinomycetota bacterium]
MVEVTGSTQEDISTLLAEKKIRSGEVLATEFQSAGRGRLDRSFEAPQYSALMFSFFIEPKRETSDWSFLTLLTGLASIYALTTLDPASGPTLKWPNDICFGDKKVGGIIAQVQGSGVIIGVGINVGMSKSELPVEHATSLALENFPQLDRNLILATFLNTFEELLTRWQQGEDLRHLYCERSATIGQQVRALHPDGSSQTGLAIGVSPVGELILEDGNRISVGDIVHLR